MKLHLLHHLHIASVMAASLALLAACGGGGGGDAPNAAQTPVVVPSSGLYAWALKAAGSTSNLKYGLSLVHPEVPGAEFVIESASDAVTAAKVVSSGTVDPSTLKVAGLQPHSLFYIVGGDVRRIPLRANGQHPKTRVQRAASSIACDFALEAVDHASPDLSRFIVTTSGTDGSCGSSDDGRAEVRLDAGGGGISFTRLSGAAPLAALRDPTTLTPLGWVTPTEVTYWAAGAPGSMALRPAANAISRVVSANYRSLVVESPSGLGLIDFSASTTFSDSPVTIAQPSGWQGLGYDSNHHYVYRSGDYRTADGRANNWQVMRVPRNAQAPSVLASGSGAIAVASLGREQIYLTVFGTSGNSLLRLPKRVTGATAVVLESGPSSTETFVITSGSDVHQRWRISGKFTSAVAYEVEMFDEAGTLLYSTSVGGFQMLLTGGSSLDFNASENRTRFVFVNGYGARAFGDAALIGYDALGRSATTIGTIPGSSTFGTDTVFAGVSGSPGTSMAGFAARSVGGSVQGNDSKVFSFDIASPSSLRITTQQQ